MFVKVCNNVYHNFEIQLPWETLKKPGQFRLPIYDIQTIDETRQASIDVMLLSAVTLNF